MKPLFTLVFVTLLVLGTNEASAQWIKIISDSTALGMKIWPKMFYGTQGQSYLMSFGVPDDSLTIEQIAPDRRLIKKLGYEKQTPDSVGYILDYGISHGRACIVMNRSKIEWTMPRVILVDLESGATIIDTLMMISRNAYFMFNPIMLISDSLGNFYFNMDVYDSTGSSPIAYMKVATNNDITLHICDSLKIGTGYLTYVKDDEATVIASGTKAVMRTPCSATTTKPILSFYTPISRIYTPDYAKTTLMYFTDSGMYTYVGLLHISADTVAPILLRMDSTTQHDQVDFVPTLDGSIFAFGKGTSGGFRLTEQNKQGVLSLDTTFAIPDGKQLESHTYHETPRGSLYGIQSFPDSTTRFLQIARKPGKPSVEAIVDYENLQATIRCHTIKDGGIAVSSYIVEYKLHSATSWISQNITTDSLRISGLTSNATYDVRIQAVNELGIGPYSDTASFTVSGGVGLIEQGPLENIRVFPNPVKAGGLIHSYGSFELYDLLGNRLPVSDVAPGIPGIYIIHVMRSGKDTYQKLVVE